MKLRFWGIVLGIATSLLVVFSSCKKERFITDSSAKLSFSKDTILYDTVFTTVHTTTKAFKIYNPHNGNLTVSSIVLAGGLQSNFRINVDGIAGTTFTNIEIPPKDSLFVFVEATIDPNNGVNPMIVQDSILFETNGNEQKVWLHAWGQDAYFHNRELIGAGTNVTWPNDKPHVIYGYVYVDSTAVLTIPPGSSIFGHNSATLFIYKSSLIANGTPGNEIIFRGDRLEPYLLADPDSVPGQWRGIWFQKALNSSITHAEIKNAEVGLQADTLTGGEFIRLSKLKINNSSAVALLAQGCNLTATNCLFGNSGNHSGIVRYGGDMEFTHCTFGNYWTESDRQTPLFVLSDYFVVNNTAFYRPFVKANFTNCIFYGPSQNDNELLLDTLDRTFSGSAPVFLFDHCLFKTDEDISNTTYYINCKKNTDPSFVGVSLWNFALSAGSGAIDAGTNTGTIDDIAGSPRDLNPDIGCYEF